MGTNGYSGNASYGQSKDSSSGTAWNNSYSLAENGTIYFNVDGDMLARGYNALAQNITAKIAGNLDLITLQDTSESRGSSFNAGAGYSSNGTISGNFGQGSSSGNSAWSNASSLIGTNSVSLNVGETLKLVGSTIANIKEDGTDGGKLNIKAKAFTWQNLQDSSSSSDKYAGISTSTGNPLENTNTPSGASTITLKNTGHQTEGVTYATIGHGNIEITSDPSGDSYAGINRDVNHRSEIISDKITGALDGSFTLDHRLFTAEGRAQIFNDLKNFPKNLLGYLGAAGRSLVYDAKFIADIFETLGDGDKIGELGFFSTMAEKVRRVDFENQLAVQCKACLDVLNGNQAKYSYEDLQKIGKIIKQIGDQAGLTTSDLSFYGLQSDPHGGGFYVIADNSVKLNLFNSKGGLQDGKSLTQAIHDEFTHRFTGNEDIANYFSAYGEGVRGLINSLFGTDFNSGSQSDYNTWVAANYNNQDFLNDSLNAYFTREGVYNADRKNEDPFYQMKYTGGSWVPMSPDEIEQRKQFDIAVTGELSKKIAIGSLEFVNWFAHSVSFGLLGSSAEAWKYSQELSESIGGVVNFISHPVDGTQKMLANWEAIDKEIARLYAAGDYTAAAKLYVDSGLQQYSVATAVGSGGMGAVKGTLAMGRLLGKTNITVLSVDVPTGVKALPEYIPTPNSLLEYYPPKGGFLGQPILETLPVGKQIDRLGSPMGSYASPVGTTFEQRALPLSKRTEKVYVYEVAKPIDAYSGTIAPAFGQPGYGIQFKFDRSIKQLLEADFLKEIKK